MFSHCIECHLKRGGGILEIFPFIHWPLGHLEMSSNPTFTLSCRVTIALDWPGDLQSAKTQPLIWPSRGMLSINLWLCFSQSMWNCENCITLANMDHHLMICNIWYEIKINLDTTAAEVRARARLKQRRTPTETPTSCIASDFLPSCCDPNLFGCNRLFFDSQLIFWWGCQASLFPCFTQSFYFWQTRITVFNEFLF